MAWFFDVEERAVRLRKAGDLLEKHESVVVAMFCKPLVKALKHSDLFYRWLSAV